jgi:hypothetical protein
LARVLEKNICSLAKEYLILVGALGFWGMTLAIVDVRAAFALLQLHRET